MAGQELLQIGNLTKKFGNTLDVINHPGINYLTDIPVNSSDAGVESTAIEILSTMGNMLVIDDDSEVGELSGRYFKSIFELGGLVETPQSLDETMEILLDPQQRKSLDLILLDYNIWGNIGGEGPNGIADVLIPLKEILGIEEFRSSMPPIVVVSTQGDQGILDPHIDFLREVNSDEYPFWIGKTVKPLDFPRAYLDIAVFAQAAKNFKQDNSGQSNGNGRLGLQRLADRQL